MAQTKFEGITKEYRESDEYKQFYNAIKNDYPNMPTYLIELGIGMHKMDPQLYKKMRNKSWKYDKVAPYDPNYKPDEAIKVYNSADEIPPNGDGQNISVTIVKNEEEPQAVLQGSSE
jgi:hypothetical protein